MAVIRYRDKRGRFRSWGVGAFCGDTEETIRQHFAKWWGPSQGWTLLGVRFHPDSPDWPQP